MHTCFVYQFIKVWRSISALSLSNKNLTLSNIKYLKRITFNGTINRPKPGNRNVVTDLNYHLGSRKILTYLINGCQFSLNCGTQLKKFNN